MDGGREGRLARTLVELAGSLASDADPAAFPQAVAERVVDALGVAAAGLVLADRHGPYRVVAWSDERALALHHLELRTGDGPCLECWRTGGAVSQVLSDPTGRWPGFGAEARAVGFSAVHALPLRLRGQMIGAISLFRDEPAPLEAADLEAGQAIADVATIGIVQQRTIAEARARAEQLQSALESRILIEQAKGLLAGRTGVSVDRAFEMLRSHARNNNLELVEVARALVEGALPVHAFGRPPPTR